MKEPIFRTSLTDEEIKRNFEDTNLFDGIMQGLEEALAFEKGDAKAASLIRKRRLPQIDVAAERRALNMTQKSFATMLGVSCRTVEAWETGKSNPSPTARNLLYLISQDHSLVSKLQRT